MNILPNSWSLRVPVSSTVTPKWERQKVVNNIGTIIIGCATHEHDFSAIYPKLVESSNEFHLRGYMRSGDYSHGLRGCVEIERLVRCHQELHWGSHRLATHARLTLLRFMYLSNALWRLKRSRHRNVSMSMRDAAVYWERDYNRLWLDRVTLN